MRLTNAWRRVWPWLLSLLITVALAEAALRVTGIGAAQYLRAAPPYQVFWQPDAELGWSYVPGSMGTFSNGYFTGHITIDEHGNRLNAPDGTRVEGYRNILFIGDSTAVSFEVDDDETIPAVLEKSLRARGLPVNVINLGVRAYSTGQSVRKAIALAELYRPTDVIYLFNENDIRGNNVVAVSPKFGKGVYIRKAGERSFLPYNYPVHRAQDAYAETVLLDAACEPTLYRHKRKDKKNPTPRQRLNRWLRNNVYVYSAVRLIVRDLTGKPDNFDLRGAETGADPYDELVVQGKDWNKDYLFAYSDGGGLRRRCRDYLDGQVRFLLDQLRRRIPSLERVHVVLYPDAPTVELLRAGAESQNAALFEAMLEEGLIDSHVNLAAAILAENIDVDELRCTGDWHFCEKGNAWIAAHVADGLELTKDQFQ